MRQTGSFWTFLLTVFFAVAASIAILPGCGDDKDRDCDSESSCDSGTLEEPFEHYDQGSSDSWPDQS